MMGAVPPLEEIFKMAGMSLPSYLKGAEEQKDVEEEKKEVAE